MMDAIKSLKLLDDTIVMYTSDHSCHFKTRDADYKRSCHESAVRVPTMITGPGLIAGGQVQALFSTPDIAPR
jgi:arylsulfatase A-like enzyme